LNEIGAPVLSVALKHATPLASGTPDASAIDVDVTVIMFCARPMVALYNIKNKTSVFMRTLFR
jgi:hypothetical protein